jgi:hypothetical protein
MGSSDKSLLNVAHQDLFWSGIEIPNNTGGGDIGCNHWAKTRGFSTFAIFLIMRHAFPFFQNQNNVRTVLFP